MHVDVRTEAHGGRPRPPDHVVARHASIPMRQSPADERMTDDHPNSLEDAGGQWLEGMDVPTFWVPASGGLGVVVFVRAGEFDEPVALRGLTEIALRAAIAAL